MASLERDPLSGYFRIRFRWGGKPFKRSLETRSEREANAILGRVEETLGLLKRGWLVMPDGAEPGAYILSDGKLTGKPVAVPPAKTVTPGGLFDVYTGGLTEESKESSTLDTERYHRNHLIRVLGPDREVETISFGDIQGYVDKRSRQTYRGRRIKRETVLQELATLSRWEQIFLGENLDAMLRRRLSREPSKAEVNRAKVG